MTLETGLTALDEFEWELGGLRWSKIGDPGDSGLDDLAEVEDDAADGSLDGSTGGQVRMTPRAIELNWWAAPVQTDEAERAAALADELDALRTVMSPLPDRSATRLLRWRRRGEPAKRIAVRPATGQPMALPGDRRRLIHDQAAVRLRLTAPDPVVLSDEYHEVTFSAGQTREIVNAGTFTAVLPSAWSLSAAGPVEIEHLDFTDEWVRFPVGPVTVSPDRIISASGAFGICWGRASAPFPKWPLLRPGTNRIRASAACTFRWRDTW